MTGFSLPTSRWQPQISHPPHRAPPRMLSQKSEQFTPNLRHSRNDALWLASMAGAPSLWKKSSNLSQGVFSSSLLLPPDFCFGAAPEENQESTERRAKPICRTDINRVRHYPLGVGKPALCATPISVEFEAQPQPGVKSETPEREGHPSAVARTTSSDDVPP